MGLGLVLLITWEMTMCSDLTYSTSALSLVCASALLLCNPEAEGFFSLSISVGGETVDLHQGIEMP